MVAGRGFPFVCGRTVTRTPPDVANTRYLLPADAKCMPVSELSARLRAMIGPVEEGQSVLTRPGYRITAKLVAGPLATLVREFREPTLITDAVLRFSQANEEDPLEILESAFDALATLVEGRILVPSELRRGGRRGARLRRGTGVSRFRDRDDRPLARRQRGLQGSVRRARLAALKIAREDRVDVTETLSQEARILDHLDGAQCPKLLRHGSERGRAYIAMEWCEGVSIAVAAQQARASGDRRRLHRLVGSMLDVYGRLHAKGVLHGDIHPGNCLVRDDDSVVLLDFGRARRVDAAAVVDPARAGLPQFYDPAMARALLAGRLPPAPTATSEQYSLAALAYLMLTGLYPVESPAIQEDLLRLIVERPPLPFAARGAPAWPGVEQVLGRALAKEPGERFSDVSDLAQAFASAPRRAARRRPGPNHDALDAILDETRALAPSADPPLQRAWFALRAALALEDAELLAAADVLVGEAEAGWRTRSVAAHIARARSDGQMERAAIHGFVAAAEPLSDAVETVEAILAAADILQGLAFRNVDAEPAARWATRRLEGLLSSSPFTAPGGEALLAEAALSLGRAGVIALPPALGGRLARLGAAREGNVWLWALAHDAYARSGYRELALAAARPRAPVARGFALLRLHQLTGEMRWVAAASRIAAERRKRPFVDIDGALLAIEMIAPERAVLPFFLVR